MLFFGFFLPMDLLLYLLAEASGLVCRLTWINGQSADCEIVHPMHPSTTAFCSTSHEFCPMLHLFLNYKGRVRLWVATLMSNEHPENLPTFQEMWRICMTTLGQPIFALLAK